MYNFTWMDECQLAFDELKKFFVSPPLLSNLESREELFLYLAATMQAISFVLIWVYDKRI